MTPFRWVPAAALLCLGPALAPANAAIRTVDLVVDENDSGCVPGDCSLREALADAGEGDEVVFALPGSPPWTIRLQTGAGLGPLVVDVGVTVTGPGSDQLTISGDSNADGTGDLRVLNVAPSGAPEISGVTLRDGRLTSSGDRDGGCVISNGDTYFLDVRFENCRAWSAGITDVGIDGGRGGAIFVVAGSALRVEDSTFAGNFGGAGGGTTGGTDQWGGGAGGAIASFGDFTVVRRSSFSGNRGGKGGPPAGPGGGGGAIAVLGGVTLIEESTFEGNASGDGGNFGAAQGPDGAGGAIWVGANATLNNVTLSGNAIGTTNIGTSATGGALHLAAGTARLRNVTATANVANGAGGGIARAAGTLEIANTVVAGNSGGGASEDCTGTLSSAGFNVVGVNNGCAASLVATDQSGTAASPLDAGLDPLADNGGPTETHALASGSPAIDGGDPGDCLGWDPNPGVDFPLATDQRGEPRPTDGDGDTSVICDAGAFEAPTFVAPTWLLNVTIGGTGSGSVTSSPSGISCPADCDEIFLDGTDVTLTPIADPGSIFTGWSGDCTGTGACVVDMTADRDVTAMFAPTHPLTVALAGAGSGTVTSTPAGISCPSDCAEDFVEGEVVTLSAVADVGSVFTGWSGDCTGTGSCQVAMSVARDVTATFAPTHPLTVALAGAGSGTVTSTPAGISCPPDCAEDFVEGEGVTLSAVADVGSVFSGWSGDCTGAGSCQVTMSAARSVTATFLPLRTLSVTVVGSGSVGSVPAGISCPADCSEDYPDGELVTLSAVADPGFELAAWSGDCTGTGTCQVTMSQNRSVTATFQPVVTPRTLTVTANGPGSVTSAPPGIACPGDCTQDFSEGTEVTLSAAPGPDAFLVAWSGDCSGTSSCVITMSVDRSVGATFDTMPFVDGFESGDTGAWSSTSP
jgi:hypothetical protein